MMNSDEERPLEGVQGDVRPGDDERMSAADEAVTEPEPAGEEPASDDSAADAEPEADAFEGLAPDLRAAIEDRGFNGLTAVQRAILDADAAGRDLRVASQTGSGKTVGLGFVMAPVVRDAAADHERDAGPVALVVTPTRELASQVLGELRWLFGGIEGAHLISVTGGTPIHRDRAALAGRPQVLVGTPGRLVDHLRNGQLDLSEVRELVLDEADQMLDMGFREDLEAILDASAGQHRTHLVSATFPPGIQDLAGRYQSNALTVEGTPIGDAHANIEHVGHLVRHNERYAALVNLLLLEEQRRTLVFVERRSDAADLAQQLEADGFRALPISGDLVQSQRDRALGAFRAGTVHVLVATDVAARGIDVPDVGVVVQTSPPIDPETYTHRSGRTGRAGQKGRSVLFCPPRRRRAVERLVADAGGDITWADVPSAADVQRVVEARDREALAGRVKEALEAGVDEGRLEFARELLGTHGAEELVAVLLDAAGPKRAARARDVGEGAPRTRGKKQDGGQRGDDRVPSAGSVRFFINWGSNQGASPSRVLAAVCRRGEVDGSTIGAISVHQNATTFDVSAEVAEEFEAKAGRRDPRDPHTMIRRDRGPGGPGGQRRRGRRGRRRGYGARRR